MMRGVKYILGSAVAVILLLVAALAGLFALYGQDLPAPQTPREMESSVSSRLLDHRGRLITELYVEDRVPLHLSQVPTAFLDAILATEDRQFRRHWGINPVRLLLALKTDLIEGRVAEGASTITQQLARNLFLHHRRTLKRKIREAILALRIERSFSKDEILELYVNTVYFGEGAYGLEAAARRFFGVPAAELTLEQCALLAGIPGNPAAFSPRRHPDASRRRRNLVLWSMRDVGAIDRETYRTAVDQPITLHDAAHDAPPGAYFNEMVRRELAERYGATRIYHAGLTVETTLDLDLQLAAEVALADHLRRLEEANQYAYLDGRADEMLAAHNLPAEEQLPSPLRLQGAVIAIDIASGAVRAMVGGRDFYESAWNRAVQAPRQPASAFKPFIYAEAVRQGYRTTDLLLDAPVAFEIADSPDSVWTLSNFDEEFYGPVTLRFALAKSINIPTARLLEQIGIRPVIELARAMGIQSRLPAVLSLAAGTGEVNLLEMTSAYGAFANHGIRVAPRLIAQVRDRYGHLLESHPPASAQVLDERTCAIVTSMLQSVVDFGTGRTARTVYGLDGALAGKTGTNDDYTDAWYIGFTPRLAVGVWVGFDWKIPIGGKSTGTGAMAALPIWSQVVRAAQAAQAQGTFEVPEDLVAIQTCRESGQIATPDCPHKVDDLFLPGSEPQESCRLHGPVAPPAGDFDEIDRRLKPRDPWAQEVPR